MSANARADRGFDTAAENPVVLSSCWALYKRGGYGARFGVPVGTRSEIKAEVHKLKRWGADIVKVMASGIVSIKEPGSITPGGFGRDELRYIVDEAAAAGLGVMAHANGEAAVTDAAEAGVRSIEHGFFMTEQSLDLLAGKGTYWTPTVAAFARAVDAAGVSNEKREFFSSIITAHLKMILRAHRNGVPLAVGTDCVLPDPRYHDAFDAELAYLQQAGLSRETVMKIACESGAKLLGLIHEPGAGYGTTSTSQISVKSQGPFQ